MEDARDNAELSGPPSPPRAQEGQALPAPLSPSHPLIPTPSHLAFALIMLGVVLSVWGYRRVLRAATRRGAIAGSEHTEPTDARALDVKALIDDAARDLGERADALEALVARAERAAERLERLHGAERAHALAPRTGTYVPPPRPARAEGGAPSLFDGRSFGPPAAPAVPPIDSMIEHRPTRDTRDQEFEAPVPGAHQHAQPTLTDDPLQREIERLARAGMTPVQIAQKLEQPVGQVELVLALRGARI